MSKKSKFVKRLLVGAAITLVGTQIYGYVRYGLFPTSPIFLIDSFTSSFFLEKTLTGHSNFVNSVAISPDGKTLVSGSEDKTIKMWNLATGEQIRTFTAAYLEPSGVNSVVISPDGKTLASGSWDNFTFKTHSRLWICLETSRTKSLDAENQLEIDTLWAEEAEKRFQAVEQSEVTLITGEQVLRELRFRSK